MDQCPHAYSPDDPVDDVSAWTEAMWLAAAALSEARSDFAGASAAYHAALRLDPIGGEALLGLARVAARTMNHDAAIEWSRRAHHAHPGDLGCALQLASHLEAARQLDEALAVLGELPAEETRVREALGTCLVLQGRLDEGMHRLRHAVEEAPESCQVRTSHAIGLWRCHERRAALRELERARALDPHDLRTRFVLAHLHLELGDYLKGYADREAIDAMYPPGIRARRWHGEPVDGKTLLLYDQHGIGDTLQMVRYAEVCAQLGARVILKLRPALLPLLQGVRGVDEWHAMDDALPAFDYQARLLDLPAVLRNTPETIPNSVPYLVPCAQRVRRVVQALAGIPKPWIGVAWRGNPQQKDGLIRSCSVADLEPLARSGFSLINLQLDATPAELERLGAHGLPDLDRDGAFLDSAALIAACDAVVTVDTAIAHLAGALAARVYLLLPYWGDWRWQADRPDTPWYPGMRLFRQARPHDWRSAIASTVDALHHSHYHHRKETS